MGEAGLRMGEGVLSWVWVFGGVRCGGLGAWGELGVTSCRRRVVRCEDDVRTWAQQ